MVKSSLRHSWFLAAAIVALSTGGTAVAQEGLVRTIEVQLHANGSADVRFLMEYPTRYYVYGVTQYRNNPYMLLREFAGRESLARNVDVKFDDGKRHVVLTMEVPTMAVKRQTRWQSSIFGGHGYRFVNQVGRELTLVASRMEASPSTLGENVQVAETVRITLPPGASEARFNPATGLSYRLDTPLFSKRRHGLFLAVAFLDLIAITGLLLGAAVAVRHFRTRPRDLELPSTAPVALPEGARPVLASTVAMSMPPRVLIEGVSGPVEGRRFALPAGEIRFGRDPANTDVLVEDPQASRLHAELSYRDGDLVLRGLSQTNPTLVNEEKIEEVSLKDGDQIRIGSSIFVLRVEST